MGPQATLARGEVRGHLVRLCPAGPPPQILTSKLHYAPSLFPTMQHERGHSHYRRLASLCLLLRRPPALLSPPPFSSPLRFSIVTVTPSEAIRSGPVSTHRKNKQSERPGHDGGNSPWGFMYMKYTLYGQGAVDGLYCQLNP